MLELSSFSWEAGRQIGLLEAVRDSPAGEVVRRELYEYFVTRKEFYESKPNFTGEMSQDPLAVGKLQFEHIVRERPCHRGFHFNRVLLGHRPSFRRDRTTGA